MNEWVEGYIVRTWVTTDYGYTFANFTPIVPLLQNDLETAMRFVRKHGHVYYKVKPRDTDIFDFAIFMQKIADNMTS